MFGSKKSEAVSGSGAAPVADKAPRMLGALESIKVWGSRASLDSHHHACSTGSTDAVHTDGAWDGYAHAYGFTGARADRTVARVACVERAPLRVDHWGVTAVEDAQPPLHLITRRFP
jgi:hypothetical protein